MKLCTTCQPSEQIIITPVQANGFSGTIPYLAMECSVCKRRHFTPQQVKTNTIKSEQFYTLISSPQQ